MFERLTKIWQMGSETPHLCAQRPKLSHSATMTKEAENLQTALALKQRSEADRREALLAGARGSADDRQHKLGVQLYNAACAYALWQDSTASGDYDMAMAFSNNLEEAADAWAQR